MKLIDKIKPEILVQLKADCEYKYDSSYRAIIAVLKSKSNYRELTIDEVKTIDCFVASEFKHHSKIIDIYYGDNLLKKEYTLG